MTTTRRTPCVGICSTTYGDLVCRGCKRFAHEIVQWNGYQADQQALIWQRLSSLRHAVVAHHLAVSNHSQFDEVSAHVAPGEVDAATRVYAVLGYLVAAQQTLTQGGLMLREPFPGGEPDGTALSVMQAVDAEIYARSQAHYERNFRTPL